MVDQRLFWLCALALLVLPFAAYGQLPFTGANPLISKGEMLANSLSWVDYLGPLAPVALSPFFGVTLLSGSAILAAQGRIPETPLTANSETLQDPLVFGTFLVLTIITSLPKLTKVTKPFAQAVDQIENYAGIITIAALQIGATLAVQEPSASASETLLTGGFGENAIAVALIALSALNLFVINTVKFLFEALIWISPVPFIDATFEAILKGTTAALMALYIYSPALAGAVDLVLFLICLALFRWTFRLTNYYRAIIFGPMASGLARKLGLAKAPTLTSTKMPSAIRASFPNPKAAIPVYPARKRKGLPKRRRSYLIATADGELILASKPLMGRAHVESFTQKTASDWTLKKGWLAHVIQDSGQGSSSVRLQVSRKYSSLLPEIAKSYGLRLAQDENAGAETMNAKEIAAALRRSKNERGELGGL